MFLYLYHQGNSPTFWKEQKTWSISRCLIHQEKNPTQTKQKQNLQSTPVYIFVIIMGEHKITFSPMDNNIHDKL